MLQTGLQNVRIFPFTQTEYKIISDGGNFYGNINNKMVYFAHVIVSCWIYVIHFIHRMAYVCMCFFIYFSLFISFSAFPAYTTSHLLFSIYSLISFTLTFFSRSLFSRTHSTFSTFFCAYRHLNKIICRQL
jgi:hypothetical protein